MWMTAAAVMVREGGYTSWKKVNMEKEMMDHNTSCERIN
jgi:hypothetical protein